jgi:hypothetical protein
VLYRYYFFDSNAQIAGCEDHPSDSDAPAIAHARETRDARGFRHGFEVWDGSRLVHSELTSEPGGIPIADKTARGQH